MQLRPEAKGNEWRDPKTKGAAQGLSPASDVFGSMGDWAYAAEAESTGWILSWMNRTSRREVP